MLKTGDTDVIECASAAMANMVAFFEPNAIRVGELGGVEVLTGACAEGQAPPRPSYVWKGEVGRGWLCASSALK